MARLGFGERPALLVIDLMRAYTTRTSPLYAEGVVAVMDDVARLLTAARRVRIPILHTRVAFDPHTFLDAGMWLRKAPVLRNLLPGSPLARFDRRALPLPRELVITKNYSGCFAGTSLAATLTALRVDTLLLAGCTTSGCVRATAMEALQRGFRPMVIEDCVGDRHPGPHAANLADLDADWADVVTRGVAERYLGALYANKRPR
jgi:maleamate amidohydrolase